MNNNPVLRMLKQTAGRWIQSLTTLRMNVTEVMTQGTQGTQGLKWDMTTSMLNQSTDRAGRAQRGKGQYIGGHQGSKNSTELLTKRITAPVPGMGGGDSKEAADTETAQALISEVDNSSSLVHVNVRATYIMGIISTIILILLILLLPCICCSKNCKTLCRWCCNGCMSADETRELQPSTLWGGFPTPLLRPSTNRWARPYSLQELQAWKAAHQHRTSPQGPSALAGRPASDPTWVPATLYPSVPSSPPPPPNTPNSSSEDIV